MNGNKKIPVVERSFNLQAIADCIKDIYLLYDRYNEFDKELSNSNNEPSQTLWKGIKEMVHKLETSEVKE